MLSHDNLTWSAKVMCRYYNLKEVRITMYIYPQYKPVSSESKWEHAKKMFYQPVHIE